MTNISTPNKALRSELHYAAIRTTTSMAELGTVLPQLWPEVHGWLAAHDLQKAAMPFIHYHAHHLAEREVLEVSIGIPTTSLATGDARVITGAFPAGDYLSTVLTGRFEGLPDAHELLRRWATQNGITLGTPTEFYLTDPGQQPDPSQWQTEIVYPIG